MIQMNGRPSGWSLKFDTNLEASEFCQKCRDNGIPLAGIKHDGEETTVYFLTEEGLFAGGPLL